MEVCDMRWKTALSVGAVAMGLAAGGCASGSNSDTASPGSGNASATISARNIAGVGVELVADDGKALYFSDQEASGTIHCVDACLQFWTPLTVGAGGAPTAGSGVTGQLATINRPDGKAQVTYDGKPLYTFALDTAGQAKGNGFSDAFGGTTFMWHAAVVSGAASAGPSSSDPYGYGY
jgi:predicted lipoprotein with Yx(FWY)xxD motif